MAYLESFPVEWHWNWKRSPMWCNFMQWGKMQILSTMHDWKTEWTFCATAHSERGRDSGIFCEESVWYCKFGTTKDKQIRDSIVIGMMDSDVSQKLQLEPDLTLERATQILRQSEQISVHFARKVKSCRFCHAGSVQRTNQLKREKHLSWLLNLWVCGWRSQPTCVSSRARNTS